MQALCHKEQTQLRDNYRNVAADLCIERELGGRRASKFFVFLFVYCHVVHPPNKPQKAAEATATTTDDDDNDNDKEGESVGDSEDDDDLESAGQVERHHRG